MSGAARHEWWRVAPAAAAPAGRWWARPEPARAGGSPLPFRGLLAFTAILVLAPQSWLPALAPLRLAFLAAAAALAACLFDRLSRSAPLSVDAPEIRITACLAAWAALTVPLSYWPGGSLSFLLENYFKTVIIFWLICNVVDTPERLRRILLALSLMSIPLSLTALYNYASGVLVPGVAHGPVTRIAGYEAPLTGNPNDLALLLNLILPLSAASFLAGGGAARRAVLLVSILLGALAVIVTFSRGGFLTLAACGLAYGWKLHRRGEGTAITAALLAALLLVPPFLPGYLDHLRSIASIGSDVTGSAQERWGDMVAAAGLLLSNPIVGAGAGMNALALNEARGEEWRMVHNVYLEYGADLGLPGLALFVLLLSRSLRSAKAAQRAGGAGGRSETFFLAEGIQVSLLGFATAAMFHPVSYHFHFYYVSGLAVAAGRISAGTEETWARS